MRPSDENQHRSKRPNLFSASHRPAGNDDNILAKLDKQAPAASGAPPRTRAFWIGGAGVLVAGLIATLAMLVQQQSERGPHRFETTVAAAPQPTVMVASGSGDERIDNAAQIIDEAPPALVTLATQPAPAVVTTPALASSPVLAAAPLRRAMPAPVQAGHRAAVTERVAVSVKAAATRPVARTAQVVAVRKPRSVPAVRAEAAPVDTDVAILTAILSQSRQIAERESVSGACGGATKCNAKTSAQ